MKRFCPVRIVALLLLLICLCAKSAPSQNAEQSNDQLEKHQVLFSPDGRRLLVTGQSHEDSSIKKLIVTRAFGLFYMTEEELLATSATMKLEEEDASSTEPVGSIFANYANPGLLTKGKIAWLPDSSGVVFCQRENGNEDLYLLDLTQEEPEKNVVRLTKHPARDFHPQITPNGKGLIFISTRGGNQSFLDLQFKGRSRKNESTESIIAVAAGSG